MKKIKIKKLKAMTLVECIIALAVFGLMGTLLITGVANVLNLQRSTNRTLGKINYQTPIAVAVHPEADEVTLLNENGTSTDDTDDIHYKINIEGRDKDIDLYMVTGFDSGYLYFEEPPVTTTTTAPPSPPPGGGP